MWVGHCVPAAFAYAFSASVHAHTSSTLLQQPPSSPPRPTSHLTYGNVHARAGDQESSQCHLAGIIVRDCSVSTSNYRSRKTLDEFCKEQGVVGISDVDTRRLTRMLRDVGCINGVISDDVSQSDEQLVQAAKVRGRRVLVQRKCCYIRRTHRQSGFAHIYGHTSTACIQQLGFPNRSPASCQHVSNTRAAAVAMQVAEMQATACNFIAGL
jgi:Carbamoyl-phosphate synthase small chain, CPSase domain